MVSRGSQKNFAAFAKDVGEEWDRSPDTFNEAFYRESIARAITFRETERIVSEQSWYQGGGIRSRVVPYAVAKLAHDAERTGRYVDFERVCWRPRRCMVSSSGRGPRIPTRWSGRSSPPAGLG